MVVRPLQYGPAAVLCWLAGLSLMRCVVAAVTPGPGLTSLLES